MKILNIFQNRWSLFIYFSFVFHLEKINKLNALSLANTTIFQHALDDIMRKKPLLTGLSESYHGLISLCGTDQIIDMKNQVDDLVLTWERVHTRLSNRLRNMQVCIN